MPGRLQVGQLGKGLFDSLDTFLLGLPSKFMEGFNNIGAAVSTEGAEKLGTSIGAAIGKATKWVIKSVKEWSKVIIDWAGNEKNWVDLGMRILSGLSNLGKQITAFGKSTAKGLLNEFGLGFDSIPILGKLALVKFEEFVVIGSQKIAGKLVHGIKVGLAKLDIQAMWNGIAKGAKTVAAVVREIFGKLIDALASFFEESLIFKPILGDKGIKKMRTFASEQRKVAKMIRASADYVSDAERAAAKERDAARKKKIAALDAELATEEKKLEALGKSFGFDEKKAKLQKELNKLRAAHAIRQKREQAKIKKQLEDQKKEKKKLSEQEERRLKATKKISEEERKRAAALKRPGDVSKEANKEDAAAKALLKSFAALMRTKATLTDPQGVGGRAIARQLKELQIKISTSRRASSLLEEALLEREIEIINK